MTLERPTALLIDGLNFIRRIYEANPAPDSLEKARGAYKACIASATRAMKTHTPEKCVLVMDAPGSTWRHQMYPAYQANRKSPPQFLTQTLPHFVNIFVKQGAHVRTEPGVDADDVIATLATVYAPDYNVVVVSTDKDMLQLLTDQIKVYDHFGKEWRNEAWVLAKFGVSPKMFRDYQAMTGDTTDNIPGVSGIGAKTAVSLLTKYGTLANILNNLPELTKSQRTNFEESATELDISLKLVTLQKDLILNVP